MKDRKKVMYLTLQWEIIYQTRLWTYLFMVMILT